MRSGVHVLRNPVLRISFITTEVMRNWTVHNTGHMPSDATESSSANLMNGYKNNCPVTMCLASAVHTTILHCWIKVHTVDPTINLFYTLMIVLLNDIV